jgi:hypothetical protein
VRAELYRPDAPDEVVAVATWNGRSAEIEVRTPFEGIENVVRASPVVSHDPGRRSLGTHGEVVLQPGDLEWFVAAVETRSQEIGLRARFVASPGEGGWDPASNYRSFEEQVRRLAAGAPD